ncbi:MAG: radical SAM protein [Syntrophaceae bacterium]|nr:radical SAM protein [Syntrophaceae bacterium]
MAERSRPLIVPFFLRNRGCRNRCVFCNERVIAGHAAPVTEAGMRESVHAALAASGGGHDRLEIAFYGGSFTGMSRAEQTELLRWAAALIAEGSARSVRIATRPDDIDGAGLDFLASMGVGAVEIGAQSLDDAVLQQSGRGHTADDVRRAVTLCKARGFETGLHLMAGLPGECRGSFEATVAEVIRIRPDTVRIHPVLVFRDTELARLSAMGRYKPLTLAEAVSWCATALVRLSDAGIPVIRLGLQATGEMTRGDGILAGPWHPSFRSLVEAQIFRAMAARLMDRAAGGAEAVFRVAPADLSNFNGPHGQNRSWLRARFGGRAITVRPDPCIPRGALRLQEGLREYGTSIAEVAGLV